METLAFIRSGDKMTVLSSVTENRASFPAFKFCRTPQAVDPDWGQDNMTLKEVLEDLRSSPIIHFALLIELSGSDDVAV